MGQYKTNVFLLMFYKMEEDFYAGQSLFLYKKAIAYSYN